MESVTDAVELKDADSEGVIDGEWLSVALVKVRVA